MKKSWVVSLALVLAAGGLSACAATKSTLDGAGYVYADSTTALVKQDQRQLAPAVPEQLLNGKATPSLKGKVVLLNVWASWCGPCRQEATALQRIADDLSDKGVVVLGVNTRDQSAAAAAFVKRLGITFPSVVDADGSAYLAGFADIVPRVYTPTSIVVDQQGRVAGWALGKADYSKLRGLLEPVVAEGRS
ncbi:MAG: hypothetical protein RL745_692 [Actinomycetota bacterium]